MSWLDGIENIERKSQESEKKRKQRREDRERQYITIFKQEFERLDRTVTKLLSELGCKWWGKNFLFQEKKFLITRTKAFPFGYVMQWELSDTVNKDYWIIELCTSPTRKEFLEREDDTVSFYFSIYAQGKRQTGDGSKEGQVISIKTTDTSEDQFKIALHSAAKNGPLSRYGSS